ncbi:hypothetical protein HKX48_006730 [Thoreauomyces humboldtii]|nr:hypothetical protein HKX48_006730 [Thoreauomyces humboldtii]
MGLRTPAVNDQIPGSERQSSPYADTLSLPADFFVTGVKSACEIALLLEIGYCGFKIDRLLEWQKDGAQQEMALVKCQRMLHCHVVSDPNSLLPASAVECATAFPVLESALSKVRKQQLYLAGLLDKAAKDLADHRRVCAQFAEMNSGLAREVSHAGVATLALTKAILADVQRAMVARIDSVLVGIELRGDDAVGWSDRILELRRKWNADLRFGSTVSHTSDMLDSGRKRKRDDDIEEESEKVARSRKRGFSPTSPHSNDHPSADTEEIVEHAGDGTLLAAAAASSAAVITATPDIVAPPSSGSDESPLIITPTNSKFIHAARVASLDTGIKAAEQLCAEASQTSGAPPSSWPRARIGATRLPYAESFVMASTPVEMIVPDRLTEIRNPLRFAGLEHDTQESDHTTLDEDDLAGMIEMELPSMAASQFATGRSAGSGLRYTAVSREQYFDEFSQPSQRHEADEEETGSDQKVEEEEADESQIPSQRDISARIESQSIMEASQSDVPASAETEGSLQLASSVSAARRDSTASIISVDSHPLPTPPTPPTPDERRMPPPSGKPRPVSLFKSSSALAPAAPSHPQHIPLRRVRTSEVVTRDVRRVGVDGKENLKDSKPNAIGSAPSSPGKSRMVLQESLSQEMPASMDGLASLGPDVSAHPVSLQLSISSGSTTSSVNAVHGRETEEDETLVWDG